MTHENEEHSIFQGKDIIECPACEEGLLWPEDTHCDNCGWRRKDTA